MQKQIQYLNIQWFMSTLWTRKNRYQRVRRPWKLRVPYADHPHCPVFVQRPLGDESAPTVSQRAAAGDAAQGLLPEDVLHRRKSYPKTHNPAMKRW